MPPEMRREKTRTTYVLPEIGERSTPAGTTALVLHLYTAVCCFLPGTICVRFVTTGYDRLWW